MTLAKGEKLRSAVREKADAIEAYRCKNLIAAVLGEIEMTS